MALTWIAGIALHVLVIGLMVALAFGVRFHRDIRVCLVLAALVLAVSLVLGHVVSSPWASREKNANDTALFIFSGVFAGAGLFFAVLGLAFYPSATGPAGKMAARPAPPNVPRCEEEVKIPR